MWCELIGKNPDAGKHWRQEEKGMTEDEMVGWHHQLDGHEFEQAPGAGDGQGGLACCVFMGSQRVRHNWATEPNWTEYIKRGLPGWVSGKESACHSGDTDSVPGLGRSPGEGKGYPLQYSGLENSMDLQSTESQRVGHDWATFTVYNLSQTSLLYLITSLSFIHFSLWFDSPFLFILE